MDFIKNPLLVYRKMMIVGVQLILIFFGLFMSYVLLIHWKRENISTRTYLIWSVIWFGYLFLSIFPKVLEPLIKDLFIIRVMDLGVIGAFMILTYITVENNVKINKCHKDIENLIRKIALSEARKRKIRK